MDVQSLTGLYTDIRSGRIVYSKTRYELRPAILFFELSGESEVVLWGKFCFEVHIDIREEWVFRPKTRCGPQSVPVFFSSQAGIQRLFLDVQSLTGLYTDIRSGRIVHSKTRYVPRTANLFFRAKRGIRGCIVVKNSVPNCI